MDIKEFAIRLTGREYGMEISKEEENLAKESGFVVIFGYSDDVVVFEGAISDEASCYGGRKIYLTPEGLYEECECECKYSILAKEKSKIIEAIWGKEYSWEFKTSIPHATFEIFEDGEKYCRGIVFDIKDLT